MVYSEDSSFCKAAFHSGVLEKADRAVKVKIEAVLDEYVKNGRNGIESKHKKGKGGKFSVRFEQSDLANI